jgi:hypothetical protein
MIPHGKRFLALELAHCCVGVFSVLMPLRMQRRRNTVAIVAVQVSHRHLYTKNVSCADS